MTASYIIPTSSNSTTLYYLTQADPGGILPSWIVNTVSKVIIPGIIKKVGKACIKYDKWRAANGINNKPWSNPEMISSPKLDWNDIKEINLEDIKSKNDSEIDESAIKENELEKIEDND